MTAKERSAISATLQIARGQISAVGSRRFIWYFYGQPSALAKPRLVIAQRCRQTE